MVRKLLLLLLLLGNLAPAREAIEDYAIQIWLNADSSLTVREDLIVRVENVAIKHGIYRDLLTRPPAATGPSSRSKIAYEIEGALLDGRPTPWLARPSSQALRVYIGDGERTLPPGLHEFTLRYRVRYAVVKTGERGRLDWNLTGDSWNFPIHAVRLHLFLPPKLSVSDVRGRVFYGPLGSTASLPLVATGERTLAFSYSQTLPPGSGLTLQLEWPTSLLKPQAAPLDPAIKVLFLALLAAVVINAVAWWRAGRDPRLEPVIPRFEPPTNTSAPLAAWLLNGGYGTRAFSAAVAQLSQLGFANLDGGREPVLRRSEKTPDETLPRELRDFFDALFASGRKSVALAQEDAQRLQNAQAALKGSLEIRGSQLLRANSSLVLLGQVVAALALGWFAYRQQNDFALGVFTAVAYTIYATAGTGLLRAAALAWERYRLIPGLSPVSELLRAALALVALLLPPLVTATLVGAFFGSTTGAISGLLLLVGPLAGYLIPAYSVKGARLRNHLLGLARYLGTTDEAALRRIGAPEDVPERLNKLFPYAVALGLEAPFAKRLEAFARLHPQRAQSVVVYGRPLTSLSTTGAGPVNLGGYTASLSQALRAAAARTQTGASGGGFSGGGFSGGGGGGGGGGGW
ncbi:DUF2207 domain-containing protein [Oceanithermus sp.]